MIRSASSAYIHVPFCRSKCFYCDFNSYAGKDSLIDGYFGALLREIRMFSEKLKSDSEIGIVPLRTIFFGGGTPTYVEPHWIREVLESLDRYFGIGPDCEITIECNPGTADERKIGEYRSAGVNRISIGLQSASGRLLEMVGRTHRAEDFVRTIEAFFRAGFVNIGVDLMEGLPGQTQADLAESLEFVTSYDIRHLSLYALSIEPGTVFHDLYSRDDSSLPDSEAEREMYHQSIETLRRKGFEHYEISNFAKPGFRCRHNVSCWEGEEYFGFGAGAHSYFNRMRYSNIPEIECYISQVASAGSWAPSDEIILRDEDMKAEFFMLGFRLLDGVGRERFDRTFGGGFEEFLPRIESLIRRGLVCRSGGMYRLTGTGLDYANRVFVEFV